MRWDALFADLEAQARALDQEERAAEVDERTRGEVGMLHVADRLRAATGTPLRVQLLGGHAAHGRLDAAGADWALLAGSGADTVVALSALVAVRGLGRFSATPGSGGVVEARLGLRHVLRGVARDRAGVQVLLTDGSTLSATLDRIGADFVEAAIHPPGEARRRGQVRDVALLPLCVVAGVRRAV